MLNSGRKAARINSFRRFFLIAASPVLIFPSGQLRAETISDDPRDMPPGAVQAPSAQDRNETIVVTGSRLNLVALAGIEPLVVVPARQMEEQNYSQIADVLNDFPGFRGSLSPEGAQDQFGQGVNFINAFGLGSNRTLTLVNGKRFVSSNGPTVFSGAAPGVQVDLNAIPSILVEQVDRLSIGGAPAYGSDAIAATVNVRLRRELTGFEASALSGISEQGDNFRWRIGAAGGTSFAGGRGNITLAASFDRVGGVSSSSRSAFRENVSSAPNPCSSFQPGLCSPFGTIAMLGAADRSPSTDGRVNPNIGFNDVLDDGNPASVLIKGFSLAATTPGGVISSGAGAYSLRFAPDGSLVPYNRGILYSAPLSGPLAAASIASGGDGLTLLDKVPLTTALERFNAAAFITYELTARLKFVADGIYYRGTADEPVDLPTFNAIHFQGASGALTFRSDNPYLSDNARQQLSALGYDETFQVSRVNTDLADRSGSSRNEIYRITAGIEGTTGIGGRDYNFELSVNYGRSSFNDFSEAISRQNFVNAVNVSLVDGAAACSLTPTVTGLPADLSPVADPGCMPLNLFGEGAPSQAALDYVIQQTRAVSRLEQFVASANFGGAPFDLFGNPVAFNIGLEHREESASFAPDLFLETGLGRGAAISRVSGSYNVDAISGEVALPFITPDNDALFSKLLAFARVRHVDNSTNGSFTAWSAGGSFAPIADIELRANYTRSFRSPAILELYSPRTSISASIPDLCSAANISAGPAPELRGANCAAFLARYPGATPLIAETASVPALAGGNPDLRNERAN
ncbi:MAG: TonB-dependent receptor, partial [Sphingomonadaceae bacterium]|nr:TonB-dependent receptor [Sphingomonadaceae bacterium]